MAISEERGCNYRNLIISMKVDSFANDNCGNFVFPKVNRLVDESRERPGWAGGPLNFLSSQFPRSLKERWEAEGVFFDDMGDS